MTATDLPASTRLTFEPLGEESDPAEVLPLFNSNPEYVAASDDFAGTRRWEMDDVERHLWQESQRENSVSLGFRWTPTGELVGLLAMLEPHPERGQPMLGLLLVHGEWQWRGIGTEVLGAVERWLAGRGWSEVLAPVLEVLPEARSFFQARGYTLREETRDQDKRAVWVLGKALSPA